MTSCVCQMELPWEALRPRPDSLTLTPHTPPSPAASPIIASKLATTHPTHPLTHNPPHTHAHTFSQPCRLISIIASKLAWFFSSSSALILARSSRSASSPPRALCGVRRQTLRYMAARVQHVCDQAITRLVVLGMSGGSNMVQTDVPPPQHHTHTHTTHTCTHHAVTMRRSSGKTGRSSRYVRSGRDEMSVLR